MLNIADVARVPRAACPPVAGQLVRRRPRILRLGAMPKRSAGMSPLLEHACAALRHGPRTIGCLGARLPLSVTQFRVRMPSLPGPQFAASLASGTLLRDVPGPCADGGSGISVLCASCWMGCADAGATPMSARIQLRNARLAQPKEHVDPTENEHYGDRGRKPVSIALPSDAGVDMPEAAVGYAETYWPGWRPRQISRTGQRRILVCRHFATWDLASFPSAGSRYLRAAARYETGARAAWPFVP